MGAPIVTATSLAGENEAKKDTPQRGGFLPESVPTLGRFGLSRKDVGQPARRGGLGAWWRETVWQALRDIPVRVRCYGTTWGPV